MTVIRSNVILSIDYSNYTVFVVNSVARVRHNSESENTNSLNVIS